MRLLVIITLLVNYHLSFAVGLNCNESSFYNSIDLAVLDCNLPAVKELKSRGFNLSIDDEGISAGLRCDNSNEILRALDIDIPSLSSKYVNHDKMINILKSKSLDYIKYLNLNHILRKESYGKYFLADDYNAYLYSSALVHNEEIFFYIVHNYPKVAKAFKGRNENKTYVNLTLKYAVGGHKYGAPVSTRIIEYILESIDETVTKYHIESFIVNPNAPDNVEVLKRMVGGLDKPINWTEEDKFLITAIKHNKENIFDFLRNNGLNLSAEKTLEAFNGTTLINTSFYQTESLKTYLNSKGLRSNKGFLVSANYKFTKQQIIHSISHELLSSDASYEQLEESILYLLSDIEDINDPIDRYSKKNLLDEVVSLSRVYVQSKSDLEWSNYLKVVDLLISQGANLNRALHTLLTDVKVQNLTGYKRIQQLGKNLMQHGSRPMPDFDYFDWMNLEAWVVDYFLSSHLSIKKDSHILFSINNMGGLSSRYSFEKNVACYLISNKVIQEIIKVVDVNYKNSSGNTVLMSILSDQYPNFSFVKSLLDNGAIWKLNEASYQLLRKSFYVDSPSGLNFVEWIVKLENDNSRVSNNFATHFMAFKNKDYELLEFVLKSTKLINNTDTSGNALIHYVAARGSRDIIEAIVASGADVNLKDSSGNTPLKIAILNQNSEVSKYLLEIGGEL